ncbi:MAG: hypothetical protein K5799_05135 [Erythrobacter sp.]|nr:hypothetical protein [Erythrobacter sp.]
MSIQPRTMIDVHGNPITVNSYEEAKKLMGGYHNEARKYATALASDMETACRLQPQAQNLQRRFDNNVKIFEYFAAQAEISSIAAAMTSIAEQTKGLSDDPG